MTISSYQVDAVIKTYTKHTRSHVRFENGDEVLPRDQHVDTVTLSRDENLKAEGFSKISYSLLDLLSKKRSPK
ncbi:MAG: hypothetical protein N2317_05995 [Syntrophales bacterium]|nr:hypothetical protein [Syntrophales bacterium]